MFLQYLYNLQKVTAGRMRLASRGLYTRDVAGFFFMSIAFVVLQPRIVQMVNR